MKYRDVLDDLFDLLNRHRMIKRWGYGNLSDLVNPLSVDDPTREDGTPSRVIDYPYAFLNPTNHTLSKGKSTFRFNLIVMDQCDDSTYEVIEAQSSAHEYIKDILAEIYYNFDQKYDFTLNSNLTPFKEKYNDTVSGMTANIELEIRDVLDDCIAPFDPKVLVEYSFTAGQQLEPDPLGAQIETAPPTYDPNGLWHQAVPGSYTYRGVYFEESGTYVVKAKGTARATESKPLPATPVLNPLKIDLTDGNILTNYGAITPINVVGWNAGTISLDSFEWEAQWIVNAAQPGSNEGIATVFLLPNESVDDESIVEFTITNLTIS